MSDFLSALTANSGWLSLVALVMAIVALAWAAALHRRVRMVTPDVRRLVRDMEGKSFDEVLTDLFANMEFLGGRIGRLENVVDDAQRRLDDTIQRVGLVRYNAEDGLGGELSFALALLNGENSGVLLTSIHTLSECRMYLRSIEGGLSVNELSEEETAALGIARHERRPDPHRSSRLRRTRWREKERAESSRDSTQRKRGDEHAE